ncbi:DNA-directed DNA polymerase [Weissella koreensis KCTC 3621]|nr:DNA-directed DNA polymerase [Weissella koreensis KCTC 3621]EJF34276.1 DNA-directed DNA polymerase [Weissella koreensis KCTC 3621]
MYLYPSLFLYRHNFSMHSKVRIVNDMADLFDIPLKLNSDRHIIHIDMDAFYAQIEMRDHPEYRDEAIILANDPRLTGGRGVVATANYQARKLGVHSAMSAVEALKLAPHARFVVPNFKLYRKTSQLVHEIFHRYTEKIEPVAFDEAYLDVTNDLSTFDSDLDLAHHLQQTIFDELKLTSSVGVSYNKFMAKLASEHNKPVGFTYIDPSQIREFLNDLKIQEIRGIGKKTIPKMNDLGIYNGYDLYQQSQATLIDHFGRAGFDFYQRIRGVDDREVEWKRERKSIGNERTYGPFLSEEADVFEAFHHLANLLETSVQQEKKHGKTLVLKVRDSEFKTETRRRTNLDFMENKADLFYDLALELWDELGGFQEPIRLLGLTMTNLAPITFTDVPLDLYGV